MLCSHKCQKIAVEIIRYDKMGYDSYKTLPYLNSDTHYKHWKCDK